MFLCRNLVRVWRLFVRVVTIVWRDKFIGLSNKMLVRVAQGLNVWSETTPCYGCHDAWGHLVLGSGCLEAPVFVVCCLGDALLGLSQRMHEILIV
jgi:hypothetical protein